MNTTEPIITHGGPDRRHRLCRCSKCGIIRRCESGLDFYTENPEGPLVCEHCLLGTIPLVVRGGNPDN